MITTNESWVMFDAGHNNQLEPASATDGDPEPDFRSNGKAPHGYRLETCGKHPNPKRASKGVTIRRLLVHEEDAQTVRLIFDGIVRGRSFAEIKRLLDSQGRISPSARQAANTTPQTGFVPWREATIKDIATNPRYTGYRFSWVDTGSAGHWLRSLSQTHEAIVSPELFMDVQRLLNSEKPIKRARLTPTAALQSLVDCSACGNTMDKRTTGSQVIRYRCQTQPSSGTSVAHIHAKDVNVKESILVEQVEEWLAMTFGPQNFEAFVRSYLSDDDASAMADAQQRLERAKTTYDLAVERLCQRSKPDFNSESSESRRLRNDASTEHRTALTAYLDASRLVGTTSKSTRDAEDLFLKWAFKVRRFLSVAQDPNAFNIFCRDLGLRVRYGDDDIEVIWSEAGIPERPTLSH